MRLSPFLNAKGKWVESGDSNETNTSVKQRGESPGSQSLIETLESLRKQSEKTKTPFENLLYDNISQV